MLSLLQKAIAVLILGFATQVQALDLGEKREFDIPPQTLSKALLEFSRQAGVQVVVGPEVTDQTAPGITGEKTIADALNSLLRGADLDYTVVGDTSIAVGNPRARKPIAPTTQALSLAQNVEQPPRSTESNASGRSLDAAAKVEEITVTGSHIRGVKETAAQTIVITREALENTGYSRLEDVFEDLPQNFAGFRPDGGYTAAASTLALQNRESSSSVDLRGLGPQSTLTLINGQRRAGSAFGRVVDLSAIPLSAIERVEVVTGGRSAVYGSDAVAGVVNVITRREFSGAETQFSYGAPTEHGGDERLQVSQIAGFTAGRFNLMGAYDYTHNTALDVVATGLTFPANAAGTAVLERRLFPDTERHSGLLSGQFGLSERMELFFDALYSTKTIDSTNRDLYQGAAQESYGDWWVTSRFADVSGGLRANVGRDWNMSLAGSTSRAKNKERIGSFYDFGGGSTAFYTISQDTDSRSSTLSLKFDGPLIALGAVTPRLAVGIEQLRERFVRDLVGGQGMDIERTVDSAYAELLLPLLENSAAGRLEVSLAGRYDDYDDVGDTSNPQLGVIWEPRAGLKLRGAYAEAFRAPSLFDLGLGNFTYVDWVADPLSASGFSQVLIQSRTRPDLRPEVATTWSAGVELNPFAVPGLKVALSYYAVDYKDRIEVPAASAQETSTFLQEEGRYVGLIQRSPSAQTLAAAIAADSDGVITNYSGMPFDPNSPDLILFDNRTNNIATEKVRGLDLIVDRSIPTQAGTLQMGFNASYTLDHDRKVTATSPVFSRIDEVGKPVSFRARANAGLTRGAYSASAYVNYQKGYDNEILPPASRVDSWTTLDISLRYNGRMNAANGFLQGISAALSVDNVFDADPPFVPNRSYGLRYDAANGSPLGRLISLRMTKRW